MKVQRIDQSNKDKFTELVDKADKHTIVLFFADWCGHCQHLKPTWNQMTDKLKSKRNIQLIEVEDTNMGLVPKKYKKSILGYPTILKFKGGKLMEQFTGNRTLDEIVAFVQKI